MTDVDRYVLESERWPRILRVMARGPLDPPFPPDQKSVGLQLGVLCLGYVEPRPNRGRPPGTEAHYDYLRVANAPTDVHRVCFQIYRDTHRETRTFGARPLAAYTDFGRLTRRELHGPSMIEEMESICAELAAHELALRESVIGPRVLRGHEASWVRFMRRRNAERA
jgi:hypothetical protein